MKKQIMRLVLLCAAFGQNQTGNAAPESDFEVNVNWAGSGLVITKYTGPGGNVVIPAKIQGFPVREIGEKAFEYCSSLASVAIPNCITEIG
ncbi:MAG: leucine-rich repeat domain-containing protein [Treponema sp.]|jgi:hypothetical protein|nr:leucine-rich repeat domain-containing protein [Treponema sp.]